MSPPSPPLRFLVVEDDDNHAEIILRSLQRNSVACDVDRVADGAEAIAYLRRQGEYVQRGLPDVILLDLKLPKLDGHEVLAKVKNDPDLQSIPVIVLSTSNALQDRVRAYECGANSYLVKPLNFLNFRKMVRDLSIYWGIWNRTCHRC